MSPALLRSTPLPCRAAQRADIRQISALRMAKAAAGHSPAAASSLTALRRSVNASFPAVGLGIRVEHCTRDLSEISHCKTMTPRPSADLFAFLNRRLRQYSSTHTPGQGGRTTRLEIGAQSSPEFICFRWRQVDG